MTTTGHQRLLADLRALLALAEAYEFHDFRNQRYVAPKIALHNHLLTIDRHVRDGKYDNRLDEDR